MIPGFGLVRKLLILVAVPVVLFVAANIVAERMVEGRLAGAAKSTFKLSEEPTVDLSAFPILLKLASRSLPGASITAAAVEVEDLTLRAIRINLTGIKADGSLLSQQVSVTVDKTTVDAEASERALNDLLRSRDVDATLDLSPEGVAVTASRRLEDGKRHEFTGRGQISLRGGDRPTLRFRPDEVLMDGEEPPARFRDRARREVSISVRLPRLPGGVRLTELEVLSAAVRISGAKENHKISFGG